MDADSFPPAPAAHPGTPARHLELSDLPPAVAERLTFEHAAPRRLRGDRLPEPLRDELAHLWDGIVADVYDEVTGLRRREALGTRAVERALRRVGDRILEAERIVIFTGCTTR